MSGLVYGVGINDAEYGVTMWEIIGYVNGKKKQKRVWVCPFYQTWVSMLARGYSETLKASRPTYKGVSVYYCWHLFSNFKAWMQTQDWEGKTLDKDILSPNNKVYSPETCVFVSGVVNSFLTDSGAARGEYKIGVSWNKKRSKFVASCSNPFTQKCEYLGLFANELEAHQAWLTKKLEHAHALAAMQTDQRVAKALVDRYENY